MENKVQKEEFDSTEVKIEVESDTSDGWEFMSKHEAEMESVPHLSVPKMHEQNEKCDSTSDGIGIDSSRQSEQRIYSHQVQEKEHERVQKKMEEAMQENFQCDEENERVRREMVEAMQDLNQNDKEKDRLKRELREPKQTVHQNEQEKDGLRKELRELTQTVHQKDQEKERIGRELYELKQTVKPEQEKDSGRKELYELKQTVLRAAESSEPQIHAIEGESSAKGVDESKTKVLSNQFNEAFQQLFRVNQPAKVVIQAKKTDKFEEEEKKYVELVSEQVKLFQKEGIEFASSDDESKE